MTADAILFDEADLNAFADGRLDATRAAALAESLATDRVAWARIDGWKRQNEGLRTLFASVLFEPVPVRLLPTTIAGSATATAPISPVEGIRTRNGSLGTQTGAHVAVMAIGVALVGFMAGALATVATDGFGRTGWGSRGAEIRPVADPSSLAERAAETYRAALADPVRAHDVADSDQARLQHWMTGQLSSAARIPDLRQQGWKLLGGRIVPGRYAPAVFLTYGQGAERLGLYVAREPVAAPVRTASTPDNALTVSSWSEDGLGVAVISAREIRGSDGTEAVRDAIRRQMTEDPISP